MGKLKNERHELFCKEYIASELNASKAYRAIYGDVKGYEQSGCKLLSNPKVTKRVEELIEQRGKRVEKKGDEFLEQLRYGALFDPSDFYRFDGTQIELRNIRELPIQARRMIQEIVPLKDGGCRIKLISKEKAIELYGRHKGSFNDKLNITAEITLESLVNESHGSEDNQ